MTELKPVSKLETGIQGFDLISEGGVPEGHTTLVAGTAGSGKTIFALQYLVSGVRDFDQRGVLVTFEEPPSDLIRNVASFGWDLAGMVERNQVAIVDATPQLDAEVIEAGSFDLVGLLVRIDIR